MNNIPEGVMIVSPDLRIVYWNTTLEEWTGISRNRILKTALIEQFPNLNSPKYLQRLQLIFAGGVPAIFSSQLHKMIIPCKFHDNTNRIQHTTVKAISIPEKEKFYALFVIQDVTDLAKNIETLTELRKREAEEIKIRKAFEESLRSRNTEMELFLDLLTHDLRNYQMLAKGFLDLTMMEDITPEESQDFLQKSRAAIVRSSDLINNISIMMKTQLAHSYDLEGVKLLDAISQTITVLKELFPDKIIVVSTKKISPEISINADSLFTQLLLNLTSNAVKNDPHEIIEIELDNECTQGRCVLSITDHGKGIPYKDREGIFDRYTQFRKKGKGSGLGLFIVKTLVKRYGGKIWIEDRVKKDYKQGTTFKVELKRVN